MLYFDASALVKRYVREAESAHVRRLFTSTVPATSRYSAVEIASAINRRAREGAIEAASRTRAIAAMNRELDAVLLVELTSTIVDRSHALLKRHDLRAGDAVQLASCLHLQERIDRDVTMVTFDDRLSDAARREGLTLAPTSSSSRPAR